MWAHELPAYFKEIGARLVVNGLIPRRFGPAVPVGEPEVVGRELRQAGRPYRLDIATDQKGEHFKLDVSPDAPEFRILNARRDERHLLLYAAGNRHGTNVGAERFLCGHDERHWFVAAVGEPVSTVMAARKALLPRDLRDKGLNKTTLKSRHNDVFVRQGEWFFVPETNPAVLDGIAEMPIMRDEPIQRGPRNKPHMIDQLVRFGGTTVVLHGGKEYSNAEWDKHVAAMEPGQRGRLGRVEHRTKDMVVYVRGKVRHPDHATIVLHGWHRVLVNGEVVSANVVFYD